MEHLKGSTHPATLLKKCPECNFILKNQFRLASTETHPHWDLFCPNLTCPRFGEVAILYQFVSVQPEKVVDSTLFPDNNPDTSIESD